ncbi:MAG TPA: hypothetical protein VMN58_11885 [Acidimicrobiales bacterium]|nr:hypothetical protein [Acidimicrobiales bacterium]
MAYVPDLMDRSRVLDAHPGVEAAGDVAGLVAMAEGADVVVVDLARPGVLEALPAVVAAAGRVVGFASHVDVGLLEAASATGCDALPRSRFFRDLDEVLRPG